MSSKPLNRIVTFALQGVLYAAFVAFVGYFASSPPYVHLPAGEALVKLSFQHAGERKEACHERTPEELSKLAPNMRAATVCPRERTPVEVEVEMDGKPLFAIIAPPSGLSKDGASTVYRRIAVPAGSHRVVAKMKDAAAGGFGYVAEHTIDLAPGRILVIDFDKQEGGWVFRG